MLCANLQRLCFLAVVGSHCTQFSAASATRTVRVANWEFEGQNSVHSVLASDAAAKIARDAGVELQLTRLTENNATKEIENNLNANNYDVVFFPGGSGHEEATDLTPGGIAAVQHFVKNGGGYVGICAGGYLATSNFSWSLHLISAAQKEPWDRGMGNVTIAFNDAGRKDLDVPYTSNVTIFYGQGPILKPMAVDGLPPYTVLATYTSEIHSKHTNETKGEMVGAPAIVTAPYGNGRVLISSPHPELTHPTLTTLLVHYVLYVADALDANATPVQADG